MLSERLQSCLNGGSILVGTVDAEGVPATCRGIAGRIDDALRRFTVYVPVQTAQETIANVATTRRIAVGVSQPLTHQSLQIKGATAGVRLARPDEAPLLQQTVETVAAILEEVGLPRRLSRAMNHWPAFAIDVVVEDIFEQTPGPNAGTPIR